MAAIFSNLPPHLRGQNQRGQDIPRHTIWLTFLELLSRFEVDELQKPAIAAAIKSVEEAPFVNADPANEMEILPWEDARIGNEAAVFGSSLEPIPRVEMQDVLLFEDDGLEDESDGGYEDALLVEFSDYEDDNQL